MLNDLSVSIFLFVSFLGVGGLGFGKCRLFVDHMFYVRWGVGGQSSAVFDIGFGDSGKGLGGGLLWDGG